MSEQSTMMKDRITIKGPDGAFGAYVARPQASPAPAVVVLQELFGVNADIRKTCDELAEQGSLPGCSIQLCSYSLPLWQVARTDVPPVQGHLHC